MIAIPFISLFLLLVVYSLRNIRRITISFLVLGFYAFCFLLSIYYLAVTDFHPPEFESMFVLSSCLLLWLLPLFSIHGNVNDANRKFIMPNHHLLDKLALITTVASLFVLLIFLLKIPFINFGDLAAERIDAVNGDIIYINNRFEQFACYLAVLFPLTIILFFYYYTFYRKQKMLCILLFISSLSEPIRIFTCGVGRDGFVSWFILFAMSYVAFSPFMTRKKKLLLVVPSLIFGGICFLLFICISISRFSHGTDSELSWLKNGVIGYLGQMPIYFNSFYIERENWPVPPGTATCAVYRIFFTRSGKILENDYLLERELFFAGSYGHGAFVFATFICDFIVEYGVWVTYIFSFFIFLVFRWMLKAPSGVDTFSCEFIRIIYAYFLILDIFYSRLLCNTVSFVSLITMLILFFIFRRNEFYFLKPHLRHCTQITCQKFFSAYTESTSSGRSQRPSGFA